MRETLLDLFGTIALLIGLTSLAVAFSCVSLWPWLQYLYPGATDDHEHRRCDNSTEQADVPSIAPTASVDTERPNIVPLSPAPGHSVAREGNVSLEK